MEICIQVTYFDFNLVKGFYSPFLESVIWFVKVPV